MPKIIKNGIEYGATPSDAGDITYSSSASYDSGTVGKAIKDLQSSVTLSSTKWATSNTDYIEAGGVKYWTFGKIVIVDVNVKFKSNVSGGVAFASGMPQCVDLVHFLIGTAPNIIRAYTEGTTLKITDTPSNSYYTGCLVYVST